MSTILPVNLGSLLYCRGVESERVEFKASWDPRTTGPRVLRTICAFANDYHNLNGGYVGVGERDGRAALPPSGLSAKEVDVDVVGDARFALTGTGERAAEEVPDARMREGARDRGRDGEDVGRAQPDPPGQGPNARSASSRP